MSDEISKEVKEAWQGAQDIRRACADAHVVRLADALCHERAMRLKAEFMKDHAFDLTLCFECSPLDRNQQHYNTDADWQAQAEADLGK